MDQNVLVPERHRSGLRLFVQLSPEDQERLVDALASADPAFEVGTAIASVAATSGQPKELVEAVVEVFLSVFRSGVLEEMPPEDFAINLAGAARKEGDSPLEPEGESRLVKNLIRILSLEDSLGITAKADRVLREQERSLLGCRVVTDVRPIFLADPSEDPVMGLVVHSLRLTYQVDHELKELYVSLGRDRIEQLIATLQRALSKQESLERLLSEKGVMCRTRESV